MYHKLFRTLGTVMYAPPSEPIRSQRPPPPETRDYWDEDEPVAEGISPQIIAIIVVIGVVLFFVGAIVCNSSAITEVSDDAEDQKEAREDARKMYKIGTILVDVGALVACVGIFYGALAPTRLDLALRVAMLSVGTAIIIVILIVMLLGPTMGATAGI